MKESIECLRMVMVLAFPPHGIGVMLPTRAVRRLKRLGQKTLIVNVKFLRNNNEKEDSILFQRDKCPARFRAGT